MGVQGLSFYGPSWLLFDVLILTGLLAAISLVLLFVYFGAKRIWPKYVRKFKITLITIISALLVSEIAILFILDILRRPDWVPFITSVH